MVSDVHLGNPLYRPRRPFVDFLRYAFDRGIPVCINGDGVDIVQSSLRRLARDLSGCNREFARFARNDMPIYYTVGNHDIALEEFLADWGVVRVVPFLNVVSGDQRIRLEHGHLYDEMRLKYPVTTNVLELLGALALRVSPTLFQKVAGFGQWIASVGELRHRSNKGTDAASQVVKEIPGERAAFIRAADEIAERGFDAVVFGHTHRAGSLRLPGGAMYYNTGAWASDPCFLEIDHGRLTLHSVADVAL